MFQFQPKRLVEDAFINTHNPAITLLLGVNSNVMVGMNGRSVIYVTGYNAKSQQKEERSAFEQVSQILIKIIRNQVSVCANILFGYCQYYLLTNPTNELLYYLPGSCRRRNSATTSVRVSKSIGSYLYSYIRTYSGCPYGTLHGKKWFPFSILSCHLSHVSLRD